MFYKDSNNNRYYLGKAFYYNNSSYGYTSATHEIFMSLGFTQVIVQPRPDGDFYVVTGPDINGAYSATPRSLEELKQRYKLKQKKTAHDTLRQTDWYVIRATELGVVAAAVPVSISSFRAAYRVVSDERCAQIDACTTVQELEALVKAPAEEYNDQTQSFEVNPAALKAWPTALASTYDYL